MEQKILFGIFLLCLVCTSWCFAQTDAELEQAIQQLGHDDYKVREHARTQLLQAGSRSVPFLRKAIESEDAEISWRARILLEDIQGAPSQAAPLEKIRPLPDVSKSVTRNFMIVQNGEMFRVQFEQNGAVQVHTEKTSPDGKQEIQEFSYTSEEEWKQQNPALYEQYQHFSQKSFWGQSFSDPTKQKRFRFKFGDFDMDLQFPEIDHFFGSSGNIDLDRLQEFYKNRHQNWKNNLQDENAILKKLLSHQHELLKQFEDLNQENFPWNDQRFDKQMEKARQQLEKTQQQLEQFRIEKKGQLGLRLVPLNEVLKAQLNCEGVLLEQVQGRAKELGFQRFDILISINNTAIKTPEEAVRVIKSLKQGEQVIFKVLRNMTEKEIAFTY